LTVAVFTREGFAALKADAGASLVRQVTVAQTYPQFGLGLSPDGKRVAYVTCDFSEGRCQAILNIYDIAADTTIRVASRTIIDSLAWSADGSQLAFVSHVPPCSAGEGLPPGKLEVVNADGSGLHTLIDRCIVRGIIGWAP
jgi:Tol biopolymer transport system component